MPFQIVFQLYYINCIYACASFCSHSHSQHLVQAWQVHFCWLCSSKGLKGRTEKFAFFSPALGVWNPSIPQWQVVWEKNNTYSSRDFVPVLWHQFGGKHSVSLKDGKSPSSLMSQQQLWIQDTIVHSIVTDNTESTCFDRGRWMGCKSQCGLRVSKWGKK